MSFLLLGRILYLSIDEGTLFLICPSNLPLNPEGEYDTKALLPIQIEIEEALDFPTLKLGDTLKKNASEIIAKFLKIFFPP
jgi:hypothetical protein